ncbi:MAG: hypothetical protein ABI794_05895 [Betaproteobacteria bacterium]
MLKKLFVVLLGTTLFAGAALTPVFAGDKADDQKKETPKDEKK